MVIHIGLENQFEGRSLAWAVEHPGCYAYGADGSSAVIAMGRAIPAYIDWIAAHSPEPWFSPAEIDIRLEEVWEDYYVDAGFHRAPEGASVNAWFLADWRPLSTLEVERGLQLLTWARGDLLTSVENMSSEELDAPRAGEAKTVRGILMHVATSAWWLLDRMDVSSGPRADLSKDAFERLSGQLDQARRALPTLAGVERVTGKQGELWSPRKVLRRLVWHERDHAAHIWKIRLQDVANQAAG